MSKQINNNPEYYHAVRQVIGEQVKTMRTELNMTQGELSEIIGIKRETISKIEAGKFNIGIDTISRLAQALDFYIFLLPKSSNDELAVEMRNRWMQSRTDN